MTMQLIVLVLYSADGRKRELRFRHGEVNIVTGCAATGKSAIIEIVDYCLGRSEFRIPEGKIKECVTWYGLLLQIREGSQVFIAKPHPSSRRAVFQSQACYLAGSRIDVPEAEQLSLNSTDEAVVASLSRLLGIGENLAVPGRYRSSLPSEAHFRHSTYYLYQDQNLIGNKDVMFHRQAEEGLRRTIRETLPFFLGIAGEDQIQISEDLRRAQSKLRKVESELSRCQAITGLQDLRARSLLEEARQAGLVRIDVEAESSEELHAALESAAAWKGKAPTEIRDERALELGDEIEELRLELLDLGRRLSAAQSFLRVADGYSDEANQQRLRLQSIGVFDPGAAVDGNCPFCQSPLTRPLPSVEAINRNLARLSEDLMTVERERPHLGRYVDSLKERKEGIREEIRAKELSLASVMSELEAARELRNSALRAARVAGRISLYFDSLEPQEEDRALHGAVGEARMQVDLLEKRLAERERQHEERRLSVLNRVSEQMTAGARELDLEHSEWPFRFDLRGLTAVADRPGHPIPMERMGGGENHLGCHLTTLLALHRVFVEDSRPLPRFLILDQPSQNYFVSPSRYTDLNGTVSDMAASDADWEAIQRLFSFVFRFCKGMKGEFQLIVLEHANLPDAMFQEAVLEEPWTRARGLVPEDWPSLDQHEGDEENREDASK